MKGLLDERMRFMSKFGVQMMNDFILKVNIKIEIIVWAWDEFRYFRSFGCDIFLFNREITILSLLEQLEQFPIWNISIR